MAMTQRKEGVIVPPMSTAGIATIAQTIRCGIGLEQERFFPIVECYEILDQIVPGAHFEVISDDEMGDDDALTLPNKKLIRLRNSVYEDAAKRGGRGRFTMAHEFGHLLLHRNVGFSRVNPNSPPKIYMNSEWQADVFASHLLISESLIYNLMTPFDIAEEFGVSLAAATARWNKSQNKK